MSKYYIECADNEPMSKPTFNDILRYTLRDIFYNARDMSLVNTVLIHVQHLNCNNHSLQNIKRFLQTVKKSDLEHYTPDQFDPEELYIPLDDWFENLQRLINML